MKLDIQVASTSQTINVFIQDSSSTTGAGLTGLVYNSGSLTAYYALPRAAAVSITLATQTVTGAYSSGGFVEISSSNMPGWYRLDLPDAAIASGRFTSIHLKGASNMAPLPIEIELTGWNNQDAVRGGLTAIPNATAGANTGLPVVGTQVPNATAGAAGGLFIAGSNAATTANITGNITGSLSGSVGSVTGNVGGNVTGNVTGNLGGTISTATRNAIADSLLLRDQTLVSSPAVNLRCPLNAIRLLNCKWTVAANTLSVYAEDDATLAWSATETVNASASPITGSDPA